MNTSLIDINYEQCIEKIHEYLISYDLLIVDVIISNITFKAIIDTGSDVCAINKNVINNCNLMNLIDIDNNTNVIGVNGINKSLGKIWYLEIEINNYSISCSFVVLDNINNKYDVILGINFLITNNINIDFRNRKLIF